MNDELNAKLQEFLDDFEMVFEKDWFYTKDAIVEYCIKRNRTFVNPFPGEDFEEEGNNWYNRGHLLASYRALRTYAISKGIFSPEARYEDEVEQDEENNQFTQREPENNDELNAKFTTFLYYFEMVFHNDWTYTEVVLINEYDDEYNNEYDIERNRTFLNPFPGEDFKEEGSNWYNRARLLASYRALRAYAISKGIFSPGASYLTSVGGDYEDEVEQDEEKGQFTQREPEKNDVVLGGEPRIVGRMVLGGLAGVKVGLGSSNFEAKSSAFFQALKYGAEGIKLIEQIFRESEDDNDLRWMAFSILYTYHQERLVLNLLEQRYSKRNPNDVKHHLARSLKQDLELYSGAMVGTDFPIEDAGIADVAIVFPTGYVLAFLLQLNAIDTESLADKYLNFLGKGADVILLLGDKANTATHKEWYLNEYGIYYTIDYCPKAPSNFQINQFPRVRDSSLPVFESGMILGRALRQTFYAWRRVNNTQIQRGLRVKNKGVRTVAGVLGALNSHYHHTKVAAISKGADGYWEVIDESQLRSWDASFSREFNDSDVANMKNIAKMMATMLSGTTSSPIDAVVLEGLDCVRQRLASTSVSQRIAALRKSLQYGEAGLELVIAALTDKNEAVIKTAYLLLQSRKEPTVQSALKRVNRWDFVECLWESKHSRSVYSVAFSPDGLLLASCNGNTIKLWNITTGRVIRTLSGHSGSVNSVAFSPDGQILASGGYDNTIKLWNVTTGQEIRTITAHLSVINSVAFSPDGQTLASGSNDRDTIKLFDVLTGEAIRTLSEHSDDFVKSVAFSPDGQRLASGSSDGTIKLSKVTTKSRRTLKGHYTQVHSIAFSPDGQTLASGGSDGTIKLWTVTTESRRTLKEHSATVKSVAFSPDGQTLASGSDDNTIKLFDVLTGEVIHTLPGHSGLVNSVAFSPDGQILASGGYGTLKLWGIRAEDLGG